MEVGGESGGIVGGAIVGMETAGMVVVKRSGLSLWVFARWGGGCRMCLGGWGLWSLCWL